MKNRSPSRPAVWAALAVVLVIAGALRFPAVSWGLPYRELGVDEGTTSRVVQVMIESGSWNPRFHRWPNVNVYVSAAVLRAAASLAAWSGQPVPSPYVLGRSVSAAAGVLTVLLIFLAGRRLHGPAAGLLAAAFLATMPLHLNRSRMWLADAPMLLFYVLTFWLSARVLERPSLLRFVLAGGGVGLATATKYNGAGACFLVIVAALAASAPSRNARVLRERATGLALAGVASLAAFAIANPHAWLDLPLFQRDLSYESSLYTAEPPTGPLGAHAAGFILRELFENGMGPFVTSLGLLGLVLLVRRTRPENLLTWAPAFLYLLVYNITFRTPLPRNFVPLLAHGALAAAVGTLAAAHAIQRLVARRWPGVRIARALAIGAALVPVPAAVGGLHAVLTGDTRIEAWEWLEASLPYGARVRREWPLLRLTRSRFNANEGGGMLSDFAYQDLVAGTDYLVAASDAWYYVLGQPKRPGFGSRARVYKRVFRGDDFELVARFSPDWSAGGPEVRVYRNRHTSGPLADGACLDLVSASASLNTRDLQRQNPHALTLSRPWEMVSGRFELAEAGRVALEVEVEASRPFPIVLGLGARARRFWIEGGRTIVLESDLEAGLVWWRIEVGRGFVDGTSALLWSPTLRRLTPPDPSDP